MKKIKWYTSHCSERVDRRERFMRKMVEKLYHFCKKNGFTYAEVYYITSDGSSTLNIRAKNSNSEAINSYTFVE